MPRWYKVTFPEHESLEEVAKAVEAGFGGLCDAYRGHEDRVVYVRPYHDTEEVMRKQFAVFVSEGFLLAFEERS